ncbi:MAG TPA: hypothetical protein VHJ78_08425 [Actinomycetota bacterium]|nr:hypothetical protein [Actinomycetota bacterium]
MFLLLALTLLGQPAFARSAGPRPVTIAVNAGYDQRRVPGKSLPISVTLEATRAIAADLQVASAAPDGTSLVRAIAVEVPAGGRKQFDLVVPAAALPTPRLQVSVREPGETLASAQVELINAGKDVLVGTTGDEIPGGIGGTRLEPSGQEMRAVKVPPEWLALGQGALQPLSYLILDSERARGLPAGEIRSIVNWVVGGGRLVVTTRDPTTLEWVPQSWRSEWTRDAAGGWVPAQSGAGRTLTSGALATPAGLGRLVVAPNSGPGDLAPVLAAVGPAPSSNSGRAELFGAPTVDFELLGALSATAGESVRLGWLVGFLVIYVVVAGPLNYVVLRRRGRKELAWLTIPLLALVFSGAAYGLARQTRGGLSVQQANVVFATPEGHASQRTVTVASGTGGQHRVDFGTRDAVEPWGMSQNFDPFGGQASRRTQMVRLTGPGSQAILETSPFSAGVANGSLRSSPGYLESDLVWDGKALAGEVTNRTGMDLTVALVAPGMREELVGRLAAGASKQVRVEASRFGGVARRFDPFLFQGGAPTDESIRRTLTRSAYSVVGAEHSFGLPMLIGFTKEFAPEVRVDGEVHTPEGPALIASPLRTTVQPGTAGPIPSMTGRLEIRSVDGTAFLGNGALQLGEFREAVFAYRLPAEVGASQVAGASVRPGFQGPGFNLEAFDWGLRRWVELPADGTSRRAVPAAAFTDAGEAHFRITPEREPFVELWSLDVEVSLK